MNNLTEATCHECGCKMWINDDGVMKCNCSFGNGTSENIDGYNYDRENWEKRFKNAFGIR